MAHMAAATVCCTAAMYVLENCDDTDPEAQLPSLPSPPTEGAADEADAEVAHANSAPDISVLGHGGRRPTSPSGWKRQTILKKHRPRIGNGAVDLSDSLHQSMPPALEDDENDSLHPANQTMIVKGGAGGVEEVEMDYAGSQDEYLQDRSLLEIPPTLRSGYIGGNFATGKVKDIFPSAGCYIIKFSPDTSLLAVGLVKGKGVALYETKHFTVIHVIEREDTVSAIDWLIRPSVHEDEFYDDERPEDSERNSHNYVRDSSSFLLAVGGFEGTLSVYSIDHEFLGENGAQLIHEERLGSEIRSMSFVPNPKLSRSFTRLVVGEKTGQISFCTLYDIDQLPGSYFHHTFREVDRLDSSVLALAVNKDGRLLAAGTKQGILRVYRIPEGGGNVVLGHRLFETQKNGAIRTVAFSPDSLRLVAGGYDRTLSIFETKTWLTVNELTTDGSINVASFDTNNEFLALGSRDKCVTFYDTSTLHPVKTMHFPGWVSDMTWGTHNHKGLVAIRGGSTFISLLNLQPIHRLPTQLRSGRGEGSSISWSSDGRFIARACDNEVIISDSLNNFKNVAGLARNDSVRCVRFCTAVGKQDHLAVVGNDGCLTVLQLRRSISQCYLENVNSRFLEAHLWAVAWSADGSILAAGGRGHNLHFVSASDLSPHRAPLKLDGRIMSIEFMPKYNNTELNFNCDSFAMAVGTSDYIATTFDTNSFEPTLRIMRPRSLMCLEYHPSLPILAMGDGGGSVAIVDLIEADVVHEFSIGSRVHSLSFSPCGSFLAVADERRRCTMYELSTLEMVQEISTKGIATEVAFSPTTGQYFALDSDNDDAIIVQLGPFLGKKLFPLLSSGNLEDIPDWVLDEVVYRSGRGPSLVQHCMLDGSKESLTLAALILKKYPEAIYTFDRESGQDCFDSALSLGKTNILKLIMTPVVDGTLENIKNGKGTLFITPIPQKGVETLYEMILNHPSEAVVEMLEKTNFVKVPFAEPRIFTSSSSSECGSCSFIDPWGSSSFPRRKLDKHLPKKDLSPHLQKAEMYRTPAVLPIPGLGSFEFLSALTTSTPPSSFDNEAMGLVLRVMWNNYIRRYFLLDIILYVIYFVIWTFFADMTASTTSSPRSNNWFFFFLIFWLFIFNTIYAMKEVVQSDFGKRKGHFRSWWNLVDFLSILFVYIYMIARLVRGAGNGSVPLAVATTLCLTLKLLAYLRGFDSTGWLISVLTQNVLDVRGFVLIIAVVLVGFMLCFRLLFGNVEGECQLVLGNEGNMLQECSKKPYGTFHDSLFSTFELAILASYDPGHFDDSDQPTLAIIIFVLAVTVVLVIALNALIAVLGDSYSRVQEHAVANRRKERAELIVEYLSLLPKRKRRVIEENTKYFHALLEADADGDLLVAKHDWEGGLNALKKDLSDQNAISDEMTRDAIAQLSNNIDVDMKQLKTDLTKMIKELSEEMKEIKRLQNDGGVTFNNHKVRNAVKVVKGVGKHLDIRTHLEKNRRPFWQGTQSPVNEESHRPFWQGTQSPVNEDGRRPFWQGFQPLSSGDQDDK